MKCINVYKNLYFVVMINMLSSYIILYYIILYYIILYYIILYYIILYYIILYYIILYYIILYYIILYYIILYYIKQTQYYILFNLVIYSCQLLVTLYIPVHVSSLFRAMRTNSHVPNN